MRAETRPARAAAASLRVLLTARRAASGVRRRACRAQLSAAARALAAVLLAACSAAAGTAAGRRRGRDGRLSCAARDWPSYNRDLAGTRISPLEQISPTNVDELRQAWSYPLGADGGTALAGSELTPLVVDGVLYATAADRVVALRADSGAEIWRFALAAGRAVAARPRATGPATARRRRASSSRRGARSSRSMRRRGRRRWRSARDGEVPMPADLQRRADAVRGSADRRLERPARAACARTTRAAASERWASRARAEAAAPGVLADGRRRSRACSMPCSRGPSPTFSTAASARRARAASRTRSSRSTRAPASAAGTFKPCTTISGTTICSRRRRCSTSRSTVCAVPMLAQAGRAGYLYVLDRVTGEPVFDIVETPVPPSDVPGERASPTQPMPTEAAADRAR